MRTQVSLEEIITFVKRVYESHTYEYDIDTVFHMAAALLNTTPSELHDLIEKPAPYDPCHACRYYHPGWLMPDVCNHCRRQHFGSVKSSDKPDMWHW